MNSSLYAGNDTATHPSVYTERMLALATRLADIPDFEVRAKEDAHALLAEAGMELPETLKIQLVANTDREFHLVMPPDPNTSLADETLESISGGTTAGSASTVGSASSMSTALSCASSAGTVSTAGTASTSD